MNDVINGQIVPALGQWQAVTLMIATFAVASILRRLGRLIKTTLTAG